MIDEDNTSLQRQLDRIERKLDHAYAGFVSVAAPGAGIVVAFTALSFQTPLKYWLAGVGFVAALLYVRWTLTRNEP